MSELIKKSSENSSEKMRCIENVLRKKQNKEYCQCECKNKHSPSLCPYRFKKKTDKKK